MASSGICCIDHQPARTAAATNRNTTNRLRAEKSMMRLIMLSSAADRRLELTFRIDQKITRGNDALSGLQTAQHFSAVTESPANGHLPLLEISVAPIDEHLLLESGVQNGGLRHRQDALAASAKLDIPVHLGFQDVARIGELDAHLDGSGRGIHLRED